MFPKLVALDTDGTIFTGKLDENVWGKGPKAVPKLADNIQQVDEHTLRDRSNHANQIHISKDIPKIVADILKNGASLAIVSRNTSKALCDRALYYIKAVDPSTGELKPIIKMTRYDEVVDESVSKHFKRIHGWSKFDYPEMLFYDSDFVNNFVREELGVTVQNCNPAQGLTWEVYKVGLKRWSRYNGKSGTKLPTKDSKPQLPTKDPKSPSTVTLEIAHFNDVYQVSDQTLQIDGKKETIDVTRFATILEDIRNKWKARSDGKKDGLTVFSGDLFSPSVESSTTRGRHMPPIINGLGVDVGCVGNHEFDFGFPRLKELINDTKFPWLLSNIIDENTRTVPETMKETFVLERGGIKIGFVGLVEEEWIATITGWPENFKYQDMAEVGKKLSARLRDPSGEYKCDIIIAVTHSRIPNDIKLARALGALSPSAQTSKNIASEHGVDLLLGGHDHVYWISKGVTAWEDYDLKSVQPDAGDDQGDVLVVKSGTDFQDLSEVILTLKSTPPGSVRKRVIQEIKGKRWMTRGHTPVNQKLKEIVDNELKTIRAAMAEPIFITEVELDTRSLFIRLNESPIGNWIADCLKPAYDEALKKLGYDQVDGVIVCTGDFRGDRVYPQGPITLGDLMTILPYLDPTIVVQLDAKALWDALESGLSKWPSQEGRFPAISGLRVKWDSRKPGGKRIREIWLTKESDQIGTNGQPIMVDKEQVLRTSTRKYLIMAGEYMVQGGDGYTALKGQKEIITAENGQSKSALIRKFLLGAQFLSKKLQEKPEERSTLQSSTRSVLGGVETKLQQLSQIPTVKLPDLQLPSMAKLNLPAWSTPKLSASTVRSAMPTFAAVAKGSSSKLPSLNMSSPSDPEDLSVDSDADDGSEASYDDLQDYVQVAVDKAAQAATDAGAQALKWLTSQRLFSVARSVAEHEDVGLLDPYERQRARMSINLLRSAPISIDINVNMNLSMLRSAGVQAAAAKAADAKDDSGVDAEPEKDLEAEAEEEEAKVEAAEKDAKGTLPIIHPIVDGRLKDVAKG